jgi:hypothetical protein
MSDHDSYRAALDAIAELEEAQIADARAAAQQNAEPEPDEPATFERELAERLHAARPKWLTFTDKEST